MESKNIKFRCSSLGDIMSGVKKKWDVENSLTCKKKLISIYREYKWGRLSNKSNKYTEKGVSVEDEAITLYCRYKKILYTKNNQRLINDYFTGEIDLYDGINLYKTKHTIDIKSSWSWETFPSFVDSINEDYEYQGLGYMDLTGADAHTIVYCLVNTPANIITDEKKKLAYKMGIIDYETEEYVNKCIEIEKNHIYDKKLFLENYPYYEFHCKEWNYDIPINDRIFEILIKRDEKKINSIKKRIDDCRVWMDKNLIQI